MAQVKAPALSPALLVQAEFVRNVMFAPIPPDIPFESTLASDFWAHCASRVKPYTKIELRAQDNAWYGEDSGSFALARRQSSRVAAPLFAAVSK